MVIFSQYFRDIFIMPYKPEHILTHSEVKSVLQQAWDLGTPMLNSKPVSDFKIKDFEVLENELNDFFKKSSRFSIEVPSAGALLKLLQNGDTKRNKAIAVVSFYVLLKMDFLTPEEKSKLSSEIYGKNVFSDYTNRVKVLTKIKEYLTSEQVEEITETKDDVPEILPDYQNSTRSNRLRIAAIILLSFAIVCFTVLKLWPSSTVNESDIKWEIAHTETVSNFDIRISFTYDFSNIKYTKATLDFGDGRTIDLKKNKGQMFHTYHKVQIRSLTLDIDGSKFVKTFTLPSRGWVAHINNDYLQENSFLKNGHMHLIENEETKPILSRDEFYVIYRKTSDFDIEMDDLLFEAKVKNPESEGGVSCFDVSFDLSGIHADTVTAISFNILKSGCTSWAKVKIGEVKLHSGNYNMTPSGQTLDEWKVIKGKVKNNNLEIFVGDTVLYKIPYKKPLGKLNQLQVLFKGNGSIDYFKIYSNNGKLLFSDDFEKHYEIVINKNSKVQKEFFNCSSVSRP